MVGDHGQIELDVLLVVVADVLDVTRVRVLLELVEQLHRRLAQHGQEVLDFAQTLARLEAFRLQRLQHERLVLAGRVHFQVVAFACRRRTIGHGRR